MGDGLTMPTHPRPRGAARGARQGKFVLTGRGARARITLVDLDGNRWPLEQVTILHGGWGSGQEGASGLPRPWRYTDAGKVQVEGDLVWIDFDRANPRRPVVVGCIRILRASDFLPERHDAPGARDNRKALRVRPVNDAGAETGHLDVEAARDDRGTLDVRGTHRLRFAVGPSDTNTTIEVVVEGAEVKVFASTEGAARSVLVSDGLQQDLGVLLVALQAFLVGTSTAVTAAQIAAFAATACSTGGWADTGIPTAMVAETFKATTLKAE